MGQFFFNVAMNSVFAFVLSKGTRPKRQSCAVSFDLANILWVGQTFFLITLFHKVKKKLNKTRQKQQYTIAFFFYYSLLATS